MLDFISLAIDEFKMIELDEVMRQRDDSQFAQILCQICTATCTEEKWITVKDDHPDYRHNALHVYPWNPHVDDQNKLKLQELAPEDQHVVIKAIDNTKDKHIQMLNLKPSDNKAVTGGLVTELHLAVVAESMLVFQMDW